MTTDNIVDTQNGSRFVVAIGEKYVFKRPRERPDRPTITREEMVEIAKIQTEIAERVPYVLPAWIEEDGGPVLVMRRAPGVLAKMLPEYERKRLKLRFHKIVEEIRKAGFSLRDLTAKNAYYDPVTDTVTPVDFHLCDRLQKAP